MEELRRVFSAGGENREVLFVFPADPEEGEQFFAEFWPEARAVSDPQGTLYDAFGVQKGSLREVFGAGVWLKLLKGVGQRSRPGYPIGDIWRMPGIFLVSEKKIEWSWKFRNIGDHPNFDDLKELIRRAP